MASGTFTVFHSPWWSHEYLRVTRNDYIANGKYLPKIDATLGILETEIEMAKPRNFKGKWWNDNETQGERQENQYSHLSLANEMFAKLLKSFDTVVPCISSLPFGCRLAKHAELLWCIESDCPAAVFMKKSPIKISLPGAGSRQQVCELLRGYFGGWNNIANLVLWASLCYNCNYVCLWVWMSDMMPKYENHHYRY